MLETVESLCNNAGESTVWQGVLKLYLWYNQDICNILEKQ